MFAKFVDWFLVALAFAAAIFAIVAWMIAAQTEDIKWIIAGYGSVVLAVATGAAAAINYSEKYIKHDD